MKEWGSVSPACLPRNCSVMKGPAIVERTYLLLGCPGVEECCAASPVWTPASLDLGKPAGEEAPQVLWSRRPCGDQPWKRGHKPSVEEGVSFPSLVPHIALGSPVIKEDVQLS